MEPRDINSVDKLIAEMEAISPFGVDPGYVGEIKIVNVNIWNIVDELKKLKKKAEKRGKPVRQVLPDDEQDEDYDYKRTRRRN